VTTARVTGADAPEPTWAVADNFAAVGERPAADLGAGLTSLSFIGTAMRRRARLWCAIAVAGLLLGLGFRVLFPPAYQASTSVLLTHGATDNPADSMLTDVTLAQSRSVAERVMAKLRLHESVGSFLAAYTVTATTDRVLLITVSAPSSSQAVLRAGALATQFLQLRAQALQTQQRLEVATLALRITQAKQQVRTLATLIAQLSAKAAFPGRRAQLASLRTQYNQENRALIGLEQAATGYPVTTVSMVHGSEILDAAAAVPHSRLRLIVVYAGTGLIAGLAVGLGLVVIQALVSDRLRRRDDVADALGAPVSLSVGRVRARRVLGRWLPGRPGFKPARGREVRRIVAHLRGAVPGSSRRAAALAVVPVDNASAVAVPLVSLALSCAQEGNRVVVADLTPGSPAAHLLGATGKPGVSAVSVHGALLVVAIPDRDDVAPVGPLRRISPQVGPAADQSAVGEALAAAYAAADLLLTLAPLDPSFGAEHLTTWATDTVAVVTAGRSSATRIHAVGEMIRLAGTPLVCAVLIGADKTDESLGAACTPSYRRRPTPDPEIVSR
jgi:capsular polysaccharide biosynthesis protein